MSVDLDLCKDIVGIGGISVSQVDDKIFIVNERVPSLGTPGNIAIYADIYGTIKSAGDSIIFDSDTNSLTVNTISTVNVETQKINTDAIQTVNAVSEQYCLTTIEDNILAKLGTYQYKDKSKFAIFLKKNETDYATAVSIDQNHRVSIEDGRLNLRKSQFIISSIGSISDHPGDIAINGIYLYYCHSEYDGKTSIWVRWKVSDINW
jgi:hypothetical protein